MFVICNEKLLVLFEERDYVRKPVSLKFLVLRRPGIIISPLIAWNEITNKLQQKCDLFGLMLNDVNKIKYNVHEQFSPFGMFCSKDIIPKTGVIALLFV